MTRTDILDELGKLPAEERLSVVEQTLHELRRELRGADARSASDRRERLSIAADALKSDYAEDRDLTAFTTLDSDDIYAAR